MSNDLTTSDYYSEPGSPSNEGFHGPAPGAGLSSGAGNSERRAIERVMRKDIAGYWREPEMQERYRQLLEEGRNQGKRP